jgi:hypothetical protein
MLCGKVAEHVFGAVGNPRSQQAMVRILQRAAAPDGHEAANLGCPNTVSPSLLILRSGGANVYPTEVVCPLPDDTLLADQLERSLQWQVLRRFAHHQLHRSRLDRSRQADGAE